MATVDERIKLLEEKLKQEKAKKQRLEARKKSIEAKVIRAADTRKKILLGAFFLEKMEKNADYKVKALQQLDEYLKRDDDRVLFGFAPLPKLANGN